MPIPPKHTAIVLAMTMLGGLGAAETVLVSNVNEFVDVYIEGSTKVVVDGPAKGGKTLQIVVPSKPEHEWLAQTWVRPLAAGIEEGEVVSITFRARSMDSDSATLKASVGLGDSPYTTVVGRKIDLTKEWKKYEIKQASEKTVTAEEARFGFIFGYQEQSFEITDLKVVKITP